MKKNISANKPFRIVAVSLLVLLLVSALTVAGVEIKKRSDPFPDDSDYGSYYDQTPGKVTEKSITIGSREIALRYDRTENLKDKPVSKRADIYGTYDVYIDEGLTEYLYLFNTDVYCGFKYVDVGMATEEKFAISREKALEIANGFLEANRENPDDYKLESCEYIEWAGYYDIQFYLTVKGYKTDDVLRIWVNAEGKVTSFSEFNFKRYDKLSIDPEKYKKAEQSIDKKIEKQRKETDVSVVDSYISIDDSGKEILTKVVDIIIPVDGGNIVQRELLVQRIK